METIDYSMSRLDAAVLVEGLSIFVRTEWLSDHTRRVIVKCTENLRNLYSKDSDMIDYSMSRIELGYIILALEDLIETQSGDSPELCKRLANILDELRFLRIEYEELRHRELSQ